MNSLNPPKKDWEAECEGVTKNLEAAKSEINLVKKEIKVLRTKHDTRMKIIYALTAKEPYLFTLGKNNGVSSKIEGILRRHDLGADLKTIRDTLKDAHLHCKQD